MSGELVPVASPRSDELVLADNELSEETVRYIVDATPANTRKAYATDWRLFVTWCETGTEDPASPVTGWIARRALPASPETLCQYMRHLVEVDDRKISTVTRRLASISVAHQAADDSVDPPTRALVVRNMLKALKANHGSRPTKKVPVRTDALRRMVAELPDGLKGTRDRALLTLGFATACRRSELAALDLEDVEETGKGLTVLLRRSKTDQAGEGREVAVLYGAHPESCPVRSLRAWITAAGIEGGPVFPIPTPRLADRRPATLGP